jgi:hypothetical protein
MINPVRAGSALAVLGCAHALLNTVLLRRPARVAQPQPHRVSVLVPARDEQDRIGDCLTALRAQQPSNWLEIIVLDDESSDATGSTARAAAQGDARVRVLTGAAPPPGWLGKPHACWQLATAADPIADVLVFLDADVRLAAHAIGAALDVLDRADLDVVSPYPRQLAGSPIERLVQPLLQWSWLTFLPLRLAERSARPSLAVLNGQFLVIRRAAYERAGGHAAVRAEVLDDVALARAVRGAGGRGGLMDGTDLATCRMYTGWAQVRDGYGKSLWSAFGSPPGALGAVLVLNAGYVLPAAAALVGSRAGLIGYLAGVLGRVVSARATGGRCWPDALAHPLSIVALTGLTVRSVVRRRRGALRWKGRPIDRVA